MSIVKIEVGESKEKPPLRKLTYGKSVDVEDEHALFQSLDTDNDGFIPLKDLTEAILISTELFGLTSSQAEELVRDVDVNKDNKIDFPEFCTLMARAKKMQMRRIVLYAAQSVLGRTQQAEAFRYMTPYHNCSPPPVFMIIVSIVQIAFYAYFKFGIYDLNQDPIPAPVTVSETTFIPDYSTALVDYSDFNSTSNLTTPVYEDLITSTSVYNNSTTEVAKVLTEEEIYHKYCDPILDRDTVATNSSMKCILYFKMIATPNKKWELWRAFTSMFLHANLAHLIGNLALQILLGIPLELVHKAQRIAPIYFLGGLVGHMLDMVSSGGGVGASGAIFALVGAHVANVIINWSEMKFQALRFVFSILILFRILIEFLSVGSNDHIGHLDHFGGFVGGFLLGIVLLRNINIRKWERHVKLASLAIYIMIIVGCILWMIIHG